MGCYEKYITKSKIVIIGLIIPLIFIITLGVHYVFPLVGLSSEIAFSILLVFGMISFVALSLEAKMKCSKNQGIGFIILLMLFITFFVLYNFDLERKSSDIALSVLLVFGVVSFLIALAFVAFIFRLLGLDNKKESLGLPAGSIRSMIALSLILIFMMASLFLYNAVSVGQPFRYRNVTQEQVNNISSENILAIYQKGTFGNETLFDVEVRVEKSRASEDLAKQIITTMSTLVVAVSSFYFGSKVGEPQPTSTPSAPLIRSIDPPLENKRDVDFYVNISGKNLEKPKEVKLVLNSKEIIGTDILSNAEMIRCKLKILKDSEVGKWTVVVINSDNIEDQLKNAFEVI